MRSAAEPPPGIPGCRGPRPFRRRGSAAGLVVVALLAAGCGDARGPAPPRLAGPPPALDLALEETGTFGEGEVVLGRPVAVRTAAGGDRVYVADALARRVLVFDRGGRLLGRVGRDGREPGGLLGLDALEVLADGTLIVADGSLQRITRFDAAGRPLGLHTFDPELVLWPRAILALPGGDLLLAFRLPRRPRRLPWPRRRPLLHRFAPGDFDDEIEAFAEPAAGGAGESRVEDLSGQIDPGSVWIAAGGDVLWAPRLYHGRIVRFACGAGRCRNTTALAGWVPPGPAWREVDPRGVVPGEVDLLSTSGTPMAAIFRHESRGLFELSDGSLAHFTLTAAGDVRRFGVERYDAAGRLAGYAVLAEAPLGDDGFAPLPLDVLWKDADDAFYLLDRTGESAVIRRVRLVEDDGRPDTPRSSRWPAPAAAR